MATACNYGCTTLYRIQQKDMTHHAPVTGPRGRGLVRDGRGVVVVPAVAAVSVTGLLDGGHEVLPDPGGLVTSIT